MAEYVPLPKAKQMVQTEAHISAPVDAVSATQTKGQRPRGIIGVEPLGMDGPGTTREKPPQLRWLFRVVP